MTASRDPPSEELIRSGYRFCHPARNSAARFASLAPSISVKAGCPADGHRDERPTPASRTARRQSIFGRKEFPLSMKATFISRENTVGERAKRCGRILHTL